MNPDTLSFWTDIAAIFLFINAIILTLIIAVALGLGWWYLRQGRKKLALPLLYAQVYTLRVQQITMQVTNGIARVPIEIRATAAQVMTTLQILRHGRYKPQSESWQNNH